MLLVWSCSSLSVWSVTSISNNASEGEGGSTRNSGRQESDCFEGFECGAEETGG